MYVFIYYIYIIYILRAYNGISMVYWSWYIYITVDIYNIIHYNQEFDSVPWYTDIPFLGDGHTTINGKLEWPM